MINGYSLIYINFRCKLARWHSRTNFLDYLFQDWHDILTGIGHDFDAFAQLTPCEIQHIFDEAVHPYYAALHELQDVTSPIFRLFPQKHSNPRADTGQRIAKIMTQNRDKLIAQFALCLLRFQALLSFTA